MRRIETFALWFGLLFGCLGAINAYRLYFIDRDIWWTPESLALAPADAASRVSVSVQGQPIESLLQGKRLAVISSSGPTVVAPSEVRLRLNNYESVLAGRIPALLAAGVCVGGGLVAFFVGLVGLASRRAPES